MQPEKQTINSYIKLICMTAILHLYMITYISTCLKKLGIFWFCLFSGIKLRYFTEPLMNIVGLL